MAASRILRRWNRWYVYCLAAAFMCIIFLMYSHIDSDKPGVPGHHFHEKASDGDDLNHRDNNRHGGGGGGAVDQKELVYYKKDVPLIWIGGVPRSGTTLMRAMVDAHPDVRCGEETRVIPRILGMHTGMSRSQLEMTRLKEAKIDESVLNNALAAYILSIISLHGEPAARLCNKDPFTLRSMTRILSMFPRSKFILMVRDGRATVHSIISRKVTIKGFDIKTYRGALRDWNRAISAMYDECMKAGEEICLPVQYEQLVLHPKGQMEKILAFLDIPWSELVIHHEKTIGEKGGVSLSKRELSTDQVDKPVNLGALTKWVDAIPEDVRGDMRKIAPMLEKLGYDVDSYPPNYGKPDDIVLQNSQRVEAEKQKLLAQGIDLEKLEAEKIVKRQEEERRLQKAGQQQRGGGGGGGPPGEMGGGPGDMARRRRRRKR